MQRRWTVHKSICLICMIGLLVYCGPKQDEVDRYTEDGVEVVLNRLEPYAIGETVTFSLEDILTIDTEKNETAETGLTDISYLDVDSKGNIFIVNQRAGEKFIFKFDKDGNFVLVRKKFFIPDVYPPFKRIIPYEERWLFVQTYEKQNEGSYVYDMFNTEGVFIARTELDGSLVRGRAESLYCLREKGSGYKELVVFKMKWE